MEERVTAYDTGTGRTTSRRPAVRRAGRTYTETKEAFKTTEFWAYIAAVVAVVVTAMVNDTSDGAAFGADRALACISLLTIGYMLCRGLAKAGSREPYTDNDDD